MKYRCTKVSGEWLKAVKSEFKMVASVEGETETDSETSGHQQRC